MNEAISGILRSEKQLNRLITSRALATERHNVRVQEDHPASQDCARPQNYHTLQTKARNAQLRQSNLTDSTFKLKITNIELDIGLEQRQCEESIYRRFFQRKIGRQCKLERQKRGFKCVAAKRVEKEDLEYQLKVKRIIDQLTDQYKLNNLADLWRQQVIIKEDSGKESSKPAHFKPDLKLQELDFILCSEQAPISTKVMKTRTQRTQLRTATSANRTYSRGLERHFLSNEKQGYTRQDTYMQFLFKVNFSNRIYVSMRLRQQKQRPAKYKAYVALGNNHMIVKGLLEKRPWLQLVGSPEGVQFLWTQNSKQSFFDGQQDCELPATTPLCKKYSKEVIDPNSLKILNKQDSCAISRFQRINSKHLRSGDRRAKLYPDFERKYEFFKSELRLVNANSTLVHNHIPNNGCLVNKKGLLASIRQYCAENGLSECEIIPETYELAPGRLQDFYQRIQKQKCFWILKPGENSNRGCGITVTNSPSQILMRVKQLQPERTLIVQVYLEKPLLYYNRKFDIRHYLLLTCVKGVFKAYWYAEGYVRTSSLPFDLARPDNLIVHLTNDAIQKYGEHYGRYEPGNKLSYSELQRFIDAAHREKKVNFFSSIMPQMKSIALTAVRSALPTLTASRKASNFELMGLDFMLDQNFKPWLIEVNTNPCLETSCPLLERLIPTLLENTLRVAVDPLLPPRELFSLASKHYFPDNSLTHLKWHLLFDELGRQSFV